MSKKAVIGFLASAACLTLACLCAPASILPLEWTPTSVPPPAVASPLPTTGPSASGEPIPACVNNLSKVLHQSETTFLSGTELETDFPLVTYTVSGDTITDPVYVDPILPKLIGYQQDTAAQKK